VSIFRRVVQHSAVGGMTDVQITDSALRLVRTYLRATLSTVSLAGTGLRSVYPRLSMSDSHVSVQFNPISSRLGRGHDMNF
jgi:hypothetical protein